MKTTTILPSGAKIEAEMSVEEFREFAFKVADRPKEDRVKRKYIKKAHPVNKKIPWTPEEDASLMSMKKSGSSCGDIALTFGRTEGAVQGRYYALRKGK